MKFSETFLHYFIEFCNKKFGDGKGVEIFENAEKRLWELAGEADYKNIR